MATPAAEDEVLAQFQSITGTDEDRAKFFLDSAQGKLDLALTTFFDGESQDIEQPPSLRESLSHPTPPSKSAPSSGKKSNIHSLMHASSDEDDDDDDSGQAFFAGGSSTSGQQIIGPPKKKGEDIVKEMFKKAREQGAEIAEPGTSALKPRGLSSFGGTGFKLGSNENDTEMVKDPSASSSTGQQEREFTLKMWQNGFSLDDGPLRAYDDPSHREFLSFIMRGRIPMELIKEAKGGEVHINMEDHKHEEYVKPKATVKPFQGTGRILGSVLPQMTIDSKSSVEDIKQSEDQASQEVKVDDSQPTTNLQVRLTNGTRLVVKLNYEHTIGDLRRYIVVARPEYAAITFSLHTSFPNKELTDNSATLKDAGVLGAAILLRPK